MFAMNQQAIVTTTSVLVTNQQAVVTTAFVFVTNQQAVQVLNPKGHLGAKHPHQIQLLPSGS
jgi:hypothetical protein